MSGRVFALRLSRSRNHTRIKSGACLSWQRFGLHQLF